MASWVLVVQHEAFDVRLAMSVCPVLTWLRRALVPESWSTGYLLFAQFHSISDLLVYSDCIKLSEGQEGISGHRLGGPGRSERSPFIM